MKFILNQNSIAQYVRDPRNSEHRSTEETNKEKLQSCLKSNIN